MKKGPEISPLLAGIIIAVVVVIVGIFIWRGTAKKGGMSADEMAKMREMAAKAGMGTPGQRTPNMGGYGQSSGTPAMQGGR
jgi:hypothetical protein